MSKRVNLGCGSDIREGWVNVDIANLDGVDVVHDLNELPLPFDDESVQVIACQDVLEHLDYIPLLKECYRILEPGGQLHIEVPHFSSNNSFVDPTHQKRFSIKTFNFFCADTYEGHSRGYYSDFKFAKIARRRLIFTQGLPFFWNRLVSPVVNLSPKVMGYYEATGWVYLFPASNIQVILQK